MGRARERQLQGAVASQKTRVLALNLQRDELNVLRRDIESAQRSFELVSLRTSQTQMESRINQTNISVLNAAVAPTDPSRPRVALNTLVAFFLGLILAVATALVLELSNRRVRGILDLPEGLKLTALGSISSAARQIRHTPPGAPA